MLKDNLNKRICDCEEDATNKQTYYEFIKEGEQIFELEEKELDNMNEKELNDYLNFLDFLFEK